MKKFFVPLFVLTLIVVLPAISWYYLKSGISWRKEAMGELKDYGLVEEIELFPLDRLPYRFEERKGSSFIIYRMDCNTEGEIERITNVVDQFDKRPDVEFIVVGDCISKLDNRIFSGNSILTTSCQANQKLCNTLDQTIFDKSPAGERLVFVDGKGVIRRFYNTTELSEWKRLIEHVAMMLPDERKQYGRENKKK